MILSFKKLGRALRGSLPLALLFAAFFSTGVWAAELIVFSQQRCPLCVAWEREVGATYTVTPIKRLDVYSIDAQGSGVELTPTFAMFEGKECIGVLVGYRGKKQFYEWIKEVLKQ